jgi:hypothetical protein
MKTRTGTSHFISRASAYAYYRPYDYSVQDVYQKIKSGEIVIQNIPKEWKGFFDKEGRFFKED